MKTLYTLVALLCIQLTSTVQNLFQVTDPNFQSFLSANFPNAIVLEDDDFFIDGDSPEITSVDTLNLSANFLQNINGIEAFSNLVCLYAHSNQLTNLPELPESLKYLSISNNPFTSLPTLPSSLNILVGGQDNITFLENLPESLYTLIWFEGSLENIDAFPNNIAVVIIWDCPIACLPHIPENLSVLELANTNVYCLPNMNIFLSGYGYYVCPANDSEYNPFNCNNSLSLEEQNTSIQFLEIYPNPAQSFFYLKLENMSTESIKIYSAAGVLVYEQAVSNGEQLIKIETDKLASGVYLVQVGEYVKRVVVE